MSAKAEMIKSLPVDDLGFNLILRNRITRWVVGADLTGRECNKHAKSVTVGQVMAELEKWPFWDDEGAVIGWSFARKAFYKKLLTLGMTVEDWMFLAPSPTDVMKRLLVDTAKRSKEDLYALNIRMLGRCISHDVRGSLETLLEKKIESITIGDVVSASQETWDQRYFNHHRHFCDQLSFFNFRFDDGLRIARSELEALGCKYEDGFFFQLGTKHCIVTKVATDLGLTYEEADRYLDYARIHGWGPRVL
jgi:hypothetical protein